MHAAPKAPRVCACGQPATRRINTETGASIPLFDKPYAAPHGIYRDVCETCAADITPVTK